MRFLLSFLSIILYIFTILSLNTVNALPTVGDDSDEYGCKASAGYSWNNQAQKCIRPWESQVKVITVGPKLVDCTGVTQSKCMRIRNGVRWQNFPGSIDGFNYVPGYTYRLQILETKVENPPADGSSITYDLIKVISKKASAKTTDSLLSGKWKLVAYNGEDVIGDYTATISSDRMSLIFCNGMSGDFKLKGNTFSSSGFLSTMMYCEGESMKLENAFDIEGATYSIISTRSIPAQHILSILTKKGDTYTYRR